jgi:hypothetical protein
MEPPKFSQSELADLVAEAVAWVRQQREKYRPSAIPLTADQTAALQPFFPSDILTNLRVLDISQTGETIPYPPFYERVRAGGSRVVPDASILRSPFLSRALQTCSRTPIHLCVPSLSRCSHATLHPHTCGQFRRCRRSPRSLSSSPVAFQLSTGYQTAIQTP